MPRFIMASTFVAAFLSCAVPSPSAANEPVRIVAFGDSTTAPRLDLILYATLLEEELNRRSPVPVKVINAGVRGDTTDAAALRLDRDVLAHEPALVIIQFGINDSAVDVWKSPPATGPRVPLDQFRTNLRGFIETLQERGAKVILMTPNPLSWTPALQKLYGRPPYDPTVADGFNVTLAPYTEAVRELAVATRVPLVDIARAHADHARRSTEPLLLDGIHPNGAGHALVARLLIECLATHPLLPGLEPRRK